MFFTIAENDFDCRIKYQMLDKARAEGLPEPGILVKKDLLHFGGRQLLNGERALQADDCSRTRGMPGEQSGTNDAGIFGKVGLV